VTVVVAVAVVLGVGSLWLFSGSNGPAQTRYLPRDCEHIISLKWSDLSASSLVPARQELPGLALADRCRLFVRNAALRDVDIERVIAGQAADGSGTVVVYHLTRPVRGQLVADLKPFRARRKSDGPSEEVRGVPIYSLGPTVLAFPEPQVIVNGEAELVRQVLRRWSHGLAKPLSDYLQAADPSASTVVVAARAPQEHLQNDLRVPGRLVDAVRGTTVTLQYGETIRLTRTLHVEDAPLGDELRGALQTALARLVQDPKTPAPLRQALQQAQLSASPGQVQMQVALPAAMFRGTPPELLQRLLN
jgi:hypothetical protein